MSIPSPYPVRFRPQCFSHDPIKIGDPFFITIHHRSRGEKKVSTFLRREKILFSHHRRLVCRRDVAIFRFFFPRVTCFIITSLYGYIFEGRKRHETVRSRLKISSFFSPSSSLTVRFPLYLSSIFSIHNCAGLAPEFTRCGTIYRGFPNRSVEDS